MFKIFRRISMVLVVLIMMLSLSFSVASFVGAKMFYAVASVVTDITGYKSHASRQREEIASLNTDVDGERRRSANLVDELEDTRTRAKQLEVDLDSERRLRGELTEELVDVDARRIRAVEQLDELNVELNAERRLRSEVQEELAENRTITRMLRDEFAEASDTMARRGSGVANDLIEYRGRRQSVREAVSDTYLRLSDRSERIVSREAKGMFAEAVPYFGAAAIATLTALEIRDLCMMMKDSNELYYAVKPEERPEDDTPTICSVEIPTRAEVWEAAKTAPGSAFESTKEFGVDAADTLSDLKDLEQSDLWSFGMLVVEKSADTYESGTEAVAVSWSTLVDLWRNWNR